MKVEIPKEVADAIEEMRGFGLSSYGIICEINDPQHSSAYKQREIIFEYFHKKTNMNDLLKALVNGYTVKQEPITVTISPEQQKRVKNFYLNYQYVHGDTVLKILKFLGITIEGVND